MTITLARVVQTCTACPTQWNAWDADGRYYYLRYRSGIGTVDTYESPGWETWTVAPDGYVARFGEGLDGPSLDGEIELAEFLAAAGMELAPGAEVVPDSGAPRA